MFNQESCKFAKSHEWVFVDGDIATVGISEYAQHEISDIVFVELPKKGTKVEKGKNCAVIESVKAASDFYAPVSGEVIECNETIVGEPAIVNQSAHGKGWFFKIKMSNKADLNDLLDFKGYQESLKTAGH